MEIERYQLGRTGIEVTPIGLGCWQFSGGKGLAGGFWRGLPQDDVNAIVAAAVDGGISWFDTAEAYGRGNSERALSAALQARGVAPGDVTIATKWFPIFRAAPSIEATLPQRQEALAPYPVDLYQIHNPASFSSVEKEMAVMGKLAADGRIRAAGVSNYGADRMAAAHEALAKHGVTLASNQVRYSLLDRKIEHSGVLQKARELGITIIAYSPLAQGILTGRFHENPESAKKLHGPRRLMSQFKPKGLEKTRPLIDELTRVARDHDATPAQVALAWLIRKNGDVVVAIPGASSESQIRSNVAAMSVALDRREIERLDEISGAVSG